MASSLVAVRVESNHTDVATALKASLDTNSVATDQLVTVTPIDISSNTIILLYVYY